jgi:tetratricopeptide (TPR) repeat protein
MNSKKIILCMIVKNESKIIHRVINSILPIIDALSICDTGSSDNTTEIINDYIEIYGGELYNHKWVNFGHNRSLAFNSCIETATKLDFNLENTYALLLDADMELDIDINFIKDNLEDICYTLKQTGSTLSYYNKRLIRLDKYWQCIGVTHEYWNEKDNNSNSIKCDLLHINDHGDGGSKYDKFERDISLLIQGLIDEPLNSRYMFYLAQSYRDIGEKEKSIEMYKKHIETNPWNEEKWYSMMQIGIITDIKEDKLYWLTAAYEFRPNRSESLYYLANYCRLNKLYNQCIMFAITASKIPYPDKDILFIEDDIYKYKCLFEISIACFYSTYYKFEGHEACKKILEMKDLLNDNIINQTKKNIKFYES